MYQIERNFRPKGTVIRQHSDGRGLEYLTFPKLEETGVVKHLFTTRMGGVSEGIYGTMNLSFQRGDDPEHVSENFRRIGRVLGITPEDMVASRQTHTTNIRRVTREDKGKGVVCPADYDDIDGLVTNEKQIALVTSYADCVPLYFVDPVHEAIGLAHSGWRGTVGRMGACMVSAMQREFGSRAQDLYAAIGPSICQSCYEVGEEVAENFRTLEEECREIILEFQRSGDYSGSGKIVEAGKKQGKYQLDLWLANAVILRQAGILAQNIAITDICTCHNPEYLFSHRASNGRRGNLCAFLMLSQITNL